MSNEQISRQAFEIWAKSTTPYPDFDRNADGYYESPVIRAKWAAWHAGADFAEKTHAGGIDFASESLKLPNKRERAIAIYEGYARFARWFSLYYNEIIQVRPELPPLRTRNELMAFLSDMVIKHGIPNTRF